MERLEDIMESRRAFSRRLAEARRTAGFTQQDVAKAIGKSLRAVQNWEAGASIPYKELDELARIVRRSRAWLLDGTEVDQESLPIAEIAVRLRALEADVDRRLIGEAAQNQLAESFEEGELEAVVAVLRFAHEDGRWPLDPITWAHAIRRFESAAIALAAEKRMGGTQ